MLVIYKKVLHSILLTKCVVSNMEVTNIIQKMCDIHASYDQKL